VKTKLTYASRKVDSAQGTVFEEEAEGIEKGKWHLTHFGGEALGDRGQAAGKGKEDRCRGTSQMRPNAG